MKPLISLQYKNSNMASPEYRGAVIDAVETLVSLGLLNNSKSSLVDMVNNLVTQQKEDEKALYGHPLTKSYIKQEIQDLDEQIKMVDDELAEVEYQIKLAENPDN
ncbi:hypothetical protein [Nostoc sp.]|uniref:hypothetical protein n=1 Tax=Nostoc sp. TaxID=1180 RepID=UPI002FF77388